MGRILNDLTDKELVNLFHTNKWFNYAVKESAIQDIRDTDQEYDGFMTLPIACRCFAEIQMDCPDTECIYEEGWALENKPYILQVFMNDDGTNEIYRRY